MDSQRAVDISRGVLELLHDNDQSRARIAELELQLFGKRELWAVHLPARDQLLAMPSKVEAERYAASICLAAGEGEARVVPSPLPFDVHMAKACAILTSWLAGANEDLQQARLFVQTLRNERAVRSVDESETSAA